MPARLSLGLFLCGGRLGYKLQLSTCLCPLLNSVCVFRSAHTTSSQNPIVLQLRRKMRLGAKGCLEEGAQKEREVSTHPGEKNKTCPHLEQRSATLAPRRGGEADESRAGKELVGKARAEENEERRKESCEENQFSAEGGIIFLRTNSEKCFTDECDAVG